MTAVRAVRVGPRLVPVILPNRRDARLHTAGVILSVHAIGIMALGFRVSVPQIVTAIATAALVDVVLTLRSTGKLVWPASGMLTGSGVALILRLVGMESGSYWSWRGWHWFALVAGVSVLSKYVIRRRGSHIFNPSNLGLVLAFLVLGSGVVEPLDFWWAPLGPWMIVAYIVILGGGVMITRRLRLLEMATVFWVVLAGGLAALALSGHCMTTAWSPTPVCGQRFWTVLVTSPEILIFLFFMITDPKTIPTGAGARVAFAATLGLFATLMIAPHSVEYGAKVGLLASLVVWSPLRGIFDRHVLDRGSEVSGMASFIARLRRLPPRRAFATGVVSGVALVLMVVAIATAGVPARGVALPTSPSAPAIGLDIDPSTLPKIEIDDSVFRLDIEVDEEWVDMLAVNLAENLAIEAEAIRTGDGSLLALSDGGTRLDEMQARLDTALATGDRWADEYHFESLRMTAHDAPAAQSSAGLLFNATGSVERVRYDALGAEQDRRTEQFQLGFVLRQLASDRWLIVGMETPG